MENRIREILDRDEDAVGELVKLVGEYQARAWDKGFGKGASSVSGFKRLYMPAGPDKPNRNPFRHKVELNDFIPDRTEPETEEEKRIRLLSIHIAQLESKIVR